jgi:hypothetical protein
MKSANLRRRERREIWSDSPIRREQ